VQQSVDASNLKFVTELAWVAFYALCVLAASFTVLGSISFMRSKVGTAKSFTRLIERAEGVKLSAVILIVLAVTLLAFLGRIESQGVVGILSGIAGYVLGGLHRSPEVPGTTAKTDLADEEGDRKPLVK
jgi:hypothetical protein